eukprot:CAMPEP_0179421478 /NCGR_PEP_ID=MMETSP0799-20121207/9807_1 /TAXON_ID=46947 /ORGANISM="Geminigera cryophila, Strain CCMP2564" /LENGTH=64 /DNA_ID=CAMNT_0021195327 /DNA_START=116 /DNA_END=310 /DNA_ORIENTATION=+
MTHVRQQGVMDLIFEALDEHTHLSQDLNDAQIEQEDEEEGERVRQEREKGPNDTSDFLLSHTWV